MLAADAAVEALAAGREHDELTSYQSAYENSWIYKELQVVRNVLPLVEKYGNFWGTMLSGINMWFENFGIRMPFTMKHHPDHKALKKKTAATPIEYPKPDGVFSFDRLSSVFLSNTNHAEDQPVHLQVKDMDLQKNSEFLEFAGPSTRYCPAGVYEWIEEEGKEPRYQINAQNCVHCKTCDIKDPNQNINWVTPEGGGGAELSEYVRSLLSQRCWHFRPRLMLRRRDLAARYASARLSEIGEQDQAALKAYLKLYKEAPDSDILVDRLFDSAIRTGDITSAVRAARAQELRNGGNAETTLLLFADAWRAKKLAHGRSGGGRAIGWRQSGIHGTYPQKLGPRRTGQKRRSRRIRCPAGQFFRLLFS